MRETVLYLLDRLEPGEHRQRAIEAVVFACMRGRYSTILDMFCAAAYEAGKLEERAAIRTAAIDALRAVSALGELVQ